MSRPALFLDRDGVINRPPPEGQRYLLRPDDFVLMPGIAEAVAACNRLGLPAVVVTNQKCVAAGLLSLDELEAIHRRMRETLAGLGAELTGVCFCPHDEAAGCGCRKPLPGMLLRAAERWDLDPAASWMVGDQRRDLIAGRAAGCRTVLIGSEVHPEADRIFADCTPLADWIFRTFSPKRGLPEITPAV